MARLSMSLFEAVAYSNRVRAAACAITRGLRVVLVERILEPALQRQRGSRAPAHRGVDERIRLERDGRKAEVLAVAEVRGVDADVQRPDVAIHGEERRLARPAQQALVRRLVARVLQRQL